MAAIEIVFSKSGGIPIGMISTISDGRYLWEGLRSKGSIEFDSYESVRDYSYGECRDLVDYSGYAL